MDHHKHNSYVTSLDDEGTVYCRRDLSAKAAALTAFFANHPRPFTETVKHDVHADPWAAQKCKPVRLAKGRKTTRVAIARGDLTRSGHASDSYHGVRAIARADE